MKRFFAVLIFAAIAAVAIYGMYYVMSPVNTQKTEYMTVENAINTNGFIIRGEWVETSRSEGTVYSSLEEGERVAKDSVIGELFYGDVSEDTIKQLSVVDNKIKMAKNDINAQTVSELDETTVENSIYRRETDIISAAEDDNITAVAKYKRDINSLRAGNGFSSDDTLSELMTQRESILSNAGTSKEEINAAISGVYTTYIDGYEEQLTPDKINWYDPSAFRELSQSPKMTRIESEVDAGGPICKIVNNHVWYVMMDIPSDIMKNRKVSDDVKLRFNNMASAVAKGSIYYISEEQDGRVVVTVKCPDYLESAFSYRLVDVDLIFESFSGYKIPVQAIRTEEDGAQKVIGISRNREYDCYCKVLYTNADGGYMIVDSTDDAENKLSQMEQIVVGER